MENNNYDTIWIRNDEAPFDIWITQENIENTKGFISVMKSVETNLFFGIKTPKDKIDEFKETEECLQRALSFTANLYGGSENRTITIMDDGKKLSTWQRVNKQQKGE